MERIWRCRALLKRSWQLQSELTSLQCGTSANHGHHAGLPACLHTSTTTGADWADELDMAAAIAPERQQQEAAFGQQQTSGQYYGQDQPGGYNQQAGRHRLMFDYQRIANDVAAARKTFLIRDVMDEMILNGLAPDRVFLELSIMHCMRSSRIGDCFYYYNEMKRRGMAPSSKLQGLLISVLSREGHLHAAEEVFRKMNVNAGPDTFELQLALVNAYGEVGNVDKCHAHLKDMLTANPNIAALVTWGYNALLKAYRKATNADQIPNFPQRVLEAMREGQKAQQRLEPNAESWPMPSYALFALQKQGFHKECVELWESLPDEAKQHPESWAYNHIVMSYVKDGMGILRWPTKESALKRRIKHIVIEEQKEQEELRAAQKGASDASQARAMEADADSDSDSDSDLDHDSPTGPAGHAENANRLMLPKWVPRSEYSRLRFKALAETANYDSWQKALAYHKEMNSHGMDLPPSELIEFVEAALQMECMGFEGGSDVALDLMDRFSQDQNAHLPGRLKRFINPNIGSQLLRFAVQRSVGSLEVAHRVWDVLLQQRSRASRVAMRAYLIALQRRDPDNPRMQEVLRYGKEWHHFLARPEQYKSMKKRQGAQAEGDDEFD